ncbi:MAG: hypothetical protein K0S74_1145 [Chlamydiales bacterium]|jgi:hypothetical protein|nr:hypothetical protein [Chlamydiales bacterium]
MSWATSLIVRDPNTSIVPLSQEESYVQERALLELENKESLEAHLKNVAIHQMRDQTEERLRQIIARQEEQLRLLMQEKELLATENIALKGRVKELDETHKKEIWQLKVHPLFKDANEFVKVIIELIPHSISLRECNTQGDSLWMVLHSIGLNLVNINEPLHRPWQMPLPSEVEPKDLAKFLQFENLVAYLNFRTKSIYRQLYEVIKVMYEETNKRSVTTYHKWDIKITTLTPETIQILKDSYHIKNK